MQSLSDYINEAFIEEDAKDDMRINDIVKKSKGNSEKEVMFARNMAKAITDKAKSLRRYQASKEILGDSHDVTAIFARRAKELGNDI